MRNGGTTPGLVPPQDMVQVIETHLGQAPGTLALGVKMLAVALTEIGQCHAASVADLHRILHHIAGIRLALYRSKVTELSRNSQRDQDVLRKVLLPRIFCLDLRDENITTIVQEESNKLSKARWIIFKSR